MKVLKMLEKWGGGLNSGTPARASASRTACGRGILLLAVFAFALALPCATHAGLRAWEPSDYVQDNLVLHYDGIRNAGLAADHDDDATTWKDLSASTNNASLENGPGASGRWGDKGFVFNCSSNLWTAASRTSLSGDFTAQVACDTTSASMQDTCSWPNLLGGRAKGAAGASGGKTVWRCRICGYEYEGEELPADYICPICKHPASDFEKVIV